MNKYYVPLMKVVYIPILQAPDAKHLLNYWYYT